MSFRTDVCRRVQSRTMDDLTERLDSIQSKLAQIKEYL
jgi:hypothetical protein